MKVWLASVALTAMIGSVPAVAQTELDHRVQRTWDNIFNPPPPGDPRTNWERRRDNDRYEMNRRAERDDWQRRRAAEHADWCRYHPGGEGCGRYYGDRYYER